MGKNKNENMIDTEELTNFRANKVKTLENLYSDDQSTRRRYDQTPRYRNRKYKTAADLRNALEQGISNRDEIVEASNLLNCINPIYSSVVNYLTNMFYWRYVVIPHKLYTSSRVKAKKETKEDDYRITLNLMQEVVDGLCVETKFPALLSRMILNGGIYFTTVCDEDSIAIDTLALPDKFCRKVGESQFGTAIIDFDFSYFDSLGIRAEQINDYLKSFSSEFRKKYNKYKNDAKLRWQTLDPRFSSCIQLNEMSIPTFFYLYGGILDYEKYQDNELERNENLLKYLVIHTIPHYEDKLIFEIDEVNALHKSLKKVVDTGDKARLITTYGDVHVDKISENDTSENEVLSKAFKAIFNNAGFNSAIFTAESVEALKVSLIRDKSMMWKYVQQLVNFYNITINNWFDFKNFQADFEILQISPYTYNDDVETYKTGATLGVGKLLYAVASGIKQKNIQDTLYLEKFLGFDDITPMQTSYTQTAEDRSSGETNKSEQVKEKDSTTISKEVSKDSDIEPSDN